MVGRVKTAGLFFISRRCWSTPIQRVDVRVPFDTRPLEHPTTWEGTFALFHALWADAGRGAPYDKRRWCFLLESLEHHHRVDQRLQEISAEIADAWSKVDAPR